MSELVQLPYPDSIRLIVTDVDGTFLTDQHQVHVRTKNAVGRIRQLYPHIHVAVATGKLRRSCEGFIKELGFDDSPAASCHGAVIHGPYGEVVKTMGIGNEVAMLVLNEARRLNKCCFFFTATEVVLVNNEVGSKIDWAQESAKYDGQVVDGRENEFIQRVLSNQEVIIKATIPLDVNEAVETLTCLSQVLPAHIRVTRALPFILEILPLSVNKAVAIRHFCDMLNVTMDQVLVFGDGENDVEMLQVAKYSVAMGNAMEAAKKSAKYHTVSNNEGGVGVFLDRIFGDSTDEMK